MQRVVEQLVAIGQLDDAAEIHHRDTLTEMPHHREIVGDEQVGETDAPLRENDWRPPAWRPLTLGFNEDCTPTHGYEPTHEAAMGAFAKSWRRG
jgi:hypothetical protein